MRKKFNLNIENTEEFIKKLLFWANQFTHIAYFDSNNYYKKNNTPASYYNFEKLIGIGCLKALKTAPINNFNNLKKFLNHNNDWAFGHFSYDLKNEIENLKSGNIDNIKFPLITFFIPQYVIIQDQKGLSLLYQPGNINEKDIEILINDIDRTLVRTINAGFDKKPEIRINKNEYTYLVDKILEHIQKGDIYEMNFCNEFFIEDIEINPVTAFLYLKNISPTPFSCLYKLNDKFLISASPERFIKKIGNKIISQPIKGTIQRGENKYDDEKLIENLRNNPKEIAENTMIVDLVRNDLSKNALKGSVNIEEYCGIYSFSHVHQMISTITAEVNSKIHPVDIIKDAFPMGSMTGAPKVKAMELIEKYEKTKRGLYSGSVGYFTPEMDFDFNVIIRSILYNETKKYLNFIAGSAITANSDSESEYKECLIKAGAMMESLLNNK